jgi:hypothetical protein
MPLLLQLTSNFTCANQQSLAIATTTVNTVVRPRLVVSATKQQKPICGGKAAVATFRYDLRGLQTDQDFSLTARVGTSCTTKFDSREWKFAGFVVIVQLRAACQMLVFLLRARIVMRDHELQCAKAGRTPRS